MSRITSRNRRSRTRATVLNETLEPRRLMANIAWDGGGNGTLWSDANNWSPNQVPTANDFVTIDVPGNTTRVEIHGSTSASVFNIDCSEALDIRGSLTVAAASVIRGPLRLFGSVAGPGNFQVFGYTEVYNNANLVGPGLFTVGPLGRVVIGPTPITTFNVGREIRSNNGQIEWLSGQIRLKDARIENDGFWYTSSTAAPGNLTMVNVGGDCAFANHETGSLFVRAGTTTLSGVAIENDDDIDIAPAARLVQTGGGFHNGRFNLQAATSSLSLAGGHFFETTAGISGAGPVELGGSEHMDIRGALNLTGTLLVTGGNVESSGPFTVGRLELDGKLTRVNGATITSGLLAGDLVAQNGDVTLNGDIDWLGGSLMADNSSRFIVPALRRLLVTTGFGTRTLSGRLVVNGELQVDRGQIALDDGAIENNNLIRMNVGDDARIYPAENGGLIRNSNAAIIKSGAGSATIDVDVIHSAFSYVAVNAGSLRLGGENVNLRLAQTVPGTTLALAGDTTFTSATSLDGVRGHLRIEGGDSTYAGGLTLPQSLTFASGTFTIGGNVRGIVNITGGTANFNGATNIFDGGSLDDGGTLAGTGPVAIRGTFNWLAGMMAGAGVTTVEDGATLDIDDGLHELTRRLVNEEFVRWTGGAIVMYDGARVENNAIFVAQANDDLHFVQQGNGRSEFVNNAHFLKQLAGRVVVPPPNLDGIVFSNHGQVVVGGGRLELRCYATHSGDFHVEAGSELILSKSQALGDTSVLTGQGIVRLQDASVYVNGDQGFASGRFIVEGQSGVGFRGTRTWIGSLELRDEAQASLPVGGGHLLLMNALSIAPAAKLEINDNPVIIDYSGPSPIAAVSEAIRNGHAAGAWNGAGICSKYASVTPGVGVGFAEASEIFTSFPASFAGQWIDNTAVVLRATRYGDANLDGNVNLSDFNRLAANFGSTSGTWSRGDFNYDGRTDLADFNRLAAHFGRSSAPTLLPGASDARIEDRVFD